MVHSCERKPYAVCAVKENVTRWKSYSCKESAKQRFLDFVKEGWERVKMYDVGTKDVLMELMR